MITSKMNSRAGKIAQWVNTLAITPSNLSLLPRTHMMEGEKRFQKLSSTVTLCCDMLYLPSCQINKYNLIFKKEWPQDSYHRMPHGGKKRVV